MNEETKFITFYFSHVKGKKSHMFEFHFQFYERKKSTFLVLIYFYGSTKINQITNITK